MRTVFPCLTYLLCTRGYVGVTTQLLKRDTPHYGENVAQRLLSCTVTAYIMRAFGFAVRWVNISVGFNVVVVDVVVGVVVIDMFGREQFRASMLFHPPPPHTHTHTRPFQLCLACFPNVVPPPPTHTSPFQLWVFWPVSPTPLAPLGLTLSY